MYTEISILTESKDPPGNNAGDRCASKRPKAQEDDRDWMGGETALQEADIPAD